MSKTIFTKILCRMALVFFVATSCTIALERARDFEDGQFEIASNKLIFLELVIHDTCRCGCAILEQPVPSYILFSEILRIRVFNNLLFDELQDTESLFVNTKVLFGIKGLLTYKDQLYLTDLKDFEALPSIVEQDKQKFFIRAVFNDGTVVIETPKGIQYLKIGETWESEPTSESSNPNNKEACYTEYIYKLSNHGALEKSKVQFGETYETYIP